MDFRFEEKVEESVDRVISTVRDGMSEIAPYLSGIKSIETVERKELGPGVVYLLNLWQGSIESAPPFARPFVSENMLRWKDHAEWHEREFCVKWRLEPFQFGSLFDCGGVNSFTAHEQGGTRLVIQGTLNIYPDRIPGIPGFLSKRLRPDVEKFVVNLITPNLKGLADGLNRYYGRKN
jgi:hypothetical protein